MVYCSVDQMYRVFCLWMWCHLSEPHVRAHSCGLDALRHNVCTRQMPDQIHKVGGLLHDAATALLGVPPVGVDNVVVWAGIAPHYGCWGGPYLHMPLNICGNTPILTSYSQLPCKKWLQLVLNGHFMLASEYSGF